LETLLSRLDGGTGNRPLSGEGFAERLTAREPLYEQAARIVLDTDGCTPEEIADEIIISCL